MARYLGRGSPWGGGNCACCADWTGKKPGGGCVFGGTLPTDGEEEPSACTVSHDSTFDHRITGALVRRILCPGGGAPRSPRRGRPASLSARKLVLLAAAGVGSAHVETLRQAGSGRKLCSIASTVSLAPGVSDGRAQPPASQESASGFTLIPQAGRRGGHAHGLRVGHRLRDGRRSTCNGRLPQAAIGGQGQEPWPLTSLHCERATLEERRIISRPSGFSRARRPHPALVRYVAALCRARRVLLCKDLHC
jgi:hypothetical protein